MSSGEARNFGPLSKYGSRLRSKNTKLYNKEFKNVKKKFFLIPFT